MTESTQFLANHGMPIVFVAVLLEQLGLPLPVAPLLLAAGALSVTGEFSLLAGIGITVLACLMADTFWFYLGRLRGHRVLGLLCRISLEPDSCVRRTQNVFTRYGLRGLLVAKFLPGLNTIAPPLAGMSGVAVGRFLAIDALGSLLYGGGFIYLGHVFSDQIHLIALALADVGASVLRLVIGVGLVYIGVKYWQRQRIRRELRMAKITAAELRWKQAAEEKLVILDVRSGAELELDATLIPGAVHLRVDEIEQRHQEIPRDREVIVYCSCPNEVSSARVATLLRRKGITRVRPLLGGIDAWRELNYPLETASRAPKSAATITPLAPADGAVPAATASQDTLQKRAA